MYVHTDTHTHIYIYVYVYIYEPHEFFERESAEYCQQPSRCIIATSVNQQAVLASIKVAYQIARCKKPHTIAEELILPCSIRHDVCHAG